MLCILKVVRLNELIKAAGLSYEGLPCDLRENISALAGIADELDLVMTSGNSITAAWGKLAMEDMKAGRMEVGASRLYMHSKRSS
jgi:hypothetical protein